MHGVGNVGLDLLSVDNIERNTNKPDDNMQIKFEVTPDENAPTVPAYLRGIY